jgi:hypothetical protein
MRQPTDDRLLAFLEGSMEETKRLELLDALDTDPALAERLRAAAAGLEAIRTLAAASEAEARESATAPAGVREGTPAPLRVSPWWLAAAAAATLLVAVPVTWSLARSAAGDASNPVTIGEGTAGSPGGTPGPATAGGQPGIDSPAIPQQSDPSFVLVLHGRWPDAGQVPQDEVQARAREYWDYAQQLADDGILMAAGDLRWEPGERLGPSGVAIPVAASEVEQPDYLVGMLALRVDTYEQALAIAERSPHLRYGGRVSVRRVGAGFVTVPGMGDW